MADFPAETGLSGQAWLHRRTDGARNHDPRRSVFRLHGRTPPGLGIRYRKSDLGLRHAARVSHRELSQSEGWFPERHRSNPGRRHALCELRLRSPWRHAGERAPGIRPVVQTSAGNRPRLGLDGCGRRETRRLLSSRADHKKRWSVLREDLGLVFMHACRELRQSRVPGVTQLLNEPDL